MNPEKENSNSSESKEEKVRKLLDVVEDILRDKNDRSAKLKTYVKELSDEDLQSLYDETWKFIDRRSVENHPAFYSDSSQGSLAFYIMKAELNERKSNH